MIYIFWAKPIRAMGVGENAWELRDHSHTPCGRAWKDMCPTFQEVMGKSSVTDMSSRKGLTPKNEGRKCQITGSQGECLRIFINSFLARGWDMRKRAQETHKEQQLRE